MGNGCSTSCGHALNGCTGCGHVVRGCSPGCGDAVNGCSTDCGHVVCGCSTGCGHAVNDCSTDCGHVVSGCSTGSGHAVNDCSRLWPCCQWLQYRLWPCCQWLQHRLWPCCQWLQHRPESVSWYFRDSTLLQTPCYLHHSSPEGLVVRTCSYVKASGSLTKLAKQLGCVSLPLCQGIMFVNQVGQSMAVNLRTLHGTTTSHYRRAGGSSDLSAALYITMGVDRL